MRGYKGSMIKILGLIAAFVLPFWNIPLILKIGARKSSKDISLAWTFGVFACLVLMLPSALASTDSVFRMFAVMNVILFTAVVIQVLRYRHG
jgi:uncharacterized protein with PQ loop repeat